MTFPLHSQAQPTASGAYNFVGDLYIEGRSFEDLIEALEQHFRTAYPEAYFAIKKSVTGLRRRIEISVYKAPIDLSDREIREAYLTSISDQAHRFGYDKSNPHTDLFNSAFSLDLNVDPRYWAHRQRTIATDMPSSTLTAGNFKRALRPGDTFEILSGPNAGRIHKVLQLGKRIVLDDGNSGDGKHYWDFPTAEAFVSDGEIVRLALGTTADPDRFITFRWKRNG